jgi:beta-glucosidase/6-phospho-beta-glucosidase/beta-galactosidase/ABC-type amino acid transport substrate-binding protein
MLIRLVPQWALKYVGMSFNPVPCSEAWICSDPWPASYFPITLEVTISAPKVNGGVGESPNRYIVKGGQTTPISSSEAPETETARMPRTAHPVRPSSEPFLFGVATSDHQCEAYDARFPDVWDAWEEKLGLTPRGQATDFRNRYAEDIERARNLGCRAFRFSIAWSRVEPAPGEFSEEAFAHYGELIRTIRAAGMEPVVTLHHWTWPLHVEKRGGMIADGFPQWFRRYAAETARRLGSDVRYWITINEPNALPFGYFKFGWQRHYPMPPGLEEASAEQQVEAVGRLMRNLFLAHTAAREEIRAIHPESRVGANPCVLGLPEWFQKWADRRLTHSRSVLQWAQQEERPFAHLPAGRTGADVVLATLSMTPDRERQVLFSESYLLDRQDLLVRSDTEAAAPMDLDGKRIAVLKGSTAEHLLPRLLPKARRYTVADFSDGLRALDRGRVEAFLAGGAILSGLADQHPGRYRIIATRLPAQLYAAAVPQGDQALLNAVDTAVRRFKQTGAWAESYRRHFPHLPVPEPPRVARRTSLYSGSDEAVSSEGHPAHTDSGAPRPTRRGTELQKIRKRGRLCIAVNGQAPGFSFRDPRRGEWSGLEIDLGRAIAEQIFGDPGCVEFRPVKPGRRIPLLRTLLRAVPEFVQKLRSFTTLSNTNWWHLGMAGKLPPFLCPPECVGQQDFVGMDYYWGISTLRLGRLFQLIGAMQQRFERAPVWPRGLYHALLHHSRLFPGMEILILENGCPDRVDGYARATYLLRHIREVLRARRKGIRVSGYLCWSITTTREWGLPCGPFSDFGLYHIDLDEGRSLTRHPTPAAQVYQEIISRFQ